jgi:thiol-disulfide isomerase/thioredoxin
MALVLLWQAGVIFTDEDATATSPSGERLGLFPADTSIETPAAGGPVGLQAGDTAPNFEFSAFDGRRLKLSDFRGRVVLVNFWATWCVPCKAELPDMETLIQRNGESRLAVIGVNGGESFQLADEFIRQLDVSLTAFAYDPQEAVSGRYGVQGLPMSYFIDAEGTISRVIAGQMNLGLMQSGVDEALAP